MGNGGKWYSDDISRRKFIGSAAATGAAFTIVPSSVFGANPPSERLNIAGVGIGGMGKSNISNVAEANNIVALCDVDDEYSAKVYKTYPKAKKYRDFRVMLEKQKDIDAVIVATPDHNHAVVAMAAMELGKHVYVQKPMTHSIYEARKLTEAARRYKVATQMGNQGHSGEGVRAICEWIWDGAIGPVRKVQAWTNRPAGWWPQGVERPEETPPVPSTLDWDLWVGPAPMRPYNPIYLPFKWRGRWDFGTGVMGDMGCHIMDPVVWALKLNHPLSIEADTSSVNSESAPLVSRITYEFAARGDLPEVEVTWYDGGLMPPRPEELEFGRRMGNADGGVIFTGDKGKIMCGCYGLSPRIIPESKMREYKTPAKTIDRVPGGLEGQ